MAQSPRNSGGTAHKVDSLLHSLGPSQSAESTSSTSPTLLKAKLSALSGGRHAVVNGCISPEILTTATHCMGLKSQPYFMKFSRMSRRLVQTSTTTISVRIPARSRDQTSKEVKSKSRDQGLASHQVAWIRSISYAETNGGIGASTGSSTLDSTASLLQGEVFTVQREQLRLQDFRCKCSEIL